MKRPRRVPDASSINRWAASSIASAAIKLPASSYEASSEATSSSNSASSPQACSRKRRRSRGSYLSAASNNSFSFCHRSDFMAVHLFGAGIECALACNSSAPQASVLGLHLQHQPQVEQVLLEHVADRARLDCRRAPVRIVVLRDDDDPRVRKGGADAPRRFQPADARHLQIHQHPVVPAELLRRVSHHRCVAVAAASNRFGKVGHYGADHPAHLRAVFDDQELHVLSHFGISLTAASVRDSAGGVNGGFYEKFIRSSANFSG